MRFLWFSLHKLIRKGLKWVILLWIALITLLPLIYLGISSLKTNDELVNSPFTLPRQLHWVNYKNALEVAGLGPLLINSMIISLVSTFLCLLVASMVAYTLTRFRFKGRELIKRFFYLGILVPVTALMVPYFKLTTVLGLYNQMAGVILAYIAIGLPIAVLILIGFMQGLPGEIEESAIVDGCGFYRRFLYIILPLAKGGLVTAGTFQFITCWNEFLYAMLLTSSNRVRTVQVGIRYFSNQFTTDYTGMFAAIMISVLPSIIGYMIFQEQVIEGLTGGALKA